MCSFNLKYNLEINQSSSVLMGKKLGRATSFPLDLKKQNKTANKQQQQKP